MSSQSRSEASSRASIAALARWKNEANPSAATAAARAAFMEKFADEVDPDRTLDPAERARRAERARKEHFTRLALKSARARAAKKATTAEDAA